ncbi:MAG TPA: hypothetical protein VH165_37280 [Kofleriaceae bacterium]|jgi:hypothetical protein|nr:hypothetical protein [Kofleriaceae bacterium]
MRRSRIPLALWIAGSVGTAACHREPSATTPRAIPMPSVQVGSCATPGRDGVIGARPRLDRADRDLNGDGAVEAIVVDRSLCTGEGNCYWNVFISPAAGSSDCARYAGTFEGRALEPLPTKGDDNMADVRGYWNLHGDRLLLQSYRFLRGGYRIVEALLCRRSNDDQLDCADSEH